MRSTDKLVIALETFRASPEFIARARADYYHDYKGQHACPITQLVADARKAGLPEIASRAINGDFDATKEESDEWASSPEGQAVFAELLGVKRK